MIFFNYGRDSTRKNHKRALEVLENNPSGVRYSDLFRKLAEVLPDIPPKSIPAIIWDLDKKNEQIIKPEKRFIYPKKIRIRGN